MSKGAIAPTSIGVSSGVRTATGEAMGVKHDTGKDPWDLLPWDAVRAVVGVLSFGARKYGARNWEQGMAYSRLYAATLRHLTAWWEGEKADLETGYSHLAHAATCLLFLIAYEIRGIGHDDRPHASALLSGKSDDRQGSMHPVLSASPEA